MSTLDVSLTEKTEYWCHLFYKYRILLFNYSYYFTPEFGSYYQRGSISAGVNLYL